MSRVYPTTLDPAAAAEVSYADPATGEINRAAHRSWIAHHSHNGCDTLLISCRLHGRLHPALDLNLHVYTNYAVTMQEFASVLYAASNPTCHVWHRHTDAAFERWQFSWGHTVQPGHHPPANRRLNPSYVRYTPGGPYVIDNRRSTH
jgi:hypothetical protein